MHIHGLLEIYQANLKITSAGQVKVSGLKRNKKFKI